MLNFEKFSQLGVSGIDYWWLIFNNAFYVMTIKSIYLISKVFSGI